LTHLYADDEQQLHRVPIDHDGPVHPAVLHLLVRPVPEPRESGVVFWLHRRVQ